MKNIAKFIVGIIVAAIAIPVAFIAITAMLGVGALAITIPEVFLGIILVVAIISIPGLIVGWVMGHRKNE